MNEELREYISNFLRDAQYRVAELTYEIHQEEDVYKGDELRKIRKEIFLFVHVLFVGRYKFYDDGYNFLNWTETEIREECEYLRIRGRFLKHPYTTFANYNPVITNQTIVIGGEGFIPSGFEGQVVTFDSQGNVVSRGIARLLPQGTNTQVIGFDQFGNLVAVENGSSEATFGGDETVNNPMGLIKSGSDLDGKTALEAIRGMLNQVLNPEILTVLNNARGSFAASHQYEIGQQKSGQVSVTFSLENAENLVGVTPINVNSAGVFSNDGDFGNGTITLNLAAPLNPTSPTNVLIRVRANGPDGLSEGKTTSIKWDPRIISGVSELVSLDSAAIDALLDKSELVSSELRREYEFTVSGYPYVLIPTMLNPTGLSFDDPESGYSYDFTEVGTVNYFNGVGTYDYTVFRATYRQTTPSKVTIS
jgi:hypothetical protein